jgi:hypothetical protein
MVCIFAYQVGGTENDAMDAVIVVSLGGLVKVYTDNVTQECARLEEYLQHRGYEPTAATLWLRQHDTPARAMREAYYLARALRRKGYRVLTKSL